MDYRSVAQVARIILHTIVSERALVNEVYVAPKEYQGLVFQQCTDQNTIAYINDVVWTLKSILLAKEQTEAKIEVFCGLRLVEEWMLELQVGYMSLSDVQSIVDQITAAASYLPSMNKICVFKVSVLLDRTIPLPSKCHVCNQQPRNDGNLTLFRELPVLRVGVKTY